MIYKTARFRKKNTTTAVFKNTDRSRLPKSRTHSRTQYPQTITPAKNTASTIILAKKLTLPYSPIRQLKNRNCFYPMPSSARKAYPDQIQCFGYYPALIKHRSCRRARPRRTTYKVRLASLPTPPYCRTPSNSPSLKAFCRHRRITAMQPVKTALAFTPRS